MNFEVYSIKDLQNFVSLIDDFKANGTSDIEVVSDAIKEFVESQFDKVTEKDAEKQVGRFGIVCFKCGAPATLAEVNVTKCTAMDEPYKTVKQCNDHRECGKTEYFYDTMRKLRKTQRKQTIAYLKLNR